ncbi:MAG TPA: hypothetical protein VLE51_03520 [Candidatus Saccharimonadales bacterium]|nr:hypothetical protein [Candidatus Saccharimonadales bacterium]
MRSIEVVRSQIILPRWIQQARERQQLERRFVFFALYIASIAGFMSGLFLLANDHTKTGHVVGAVLEALMVFGFVFMAMLAVNRIFDIQIRRR